jgi:hypothetical protein
LWDAQRVGASVCVISPLWVDRAGTSYKRCEDEYEKISAHFLSPETYFPVVSSDIPRNFVTEKQSRNSTMSSQDPQRPGDTRCVSDI